MTQDPAPAWLQSNSALLGGTLESFDAYTYDHPDFVAQAQNKPGMESLWTLVKLVRGTAGYVAAFGKHRLSELVAQGFLDSRGAPFTRFAQAVGGQGDSVALQPVATLAIAKRYGEVLLELDAVMPGATQNSVIKQASSYGDCLDTLMNTPGLLDAFITYVKVVKPLLTSEDGADIDAFQNFFKETGGAVTRYAGKLSYVRTHHHFEVAALERLVANEADTSRSRPLTVIVHTARDWNGGFDRLAAMTEVIVDRRNLAIVVEGAASLADASAHVQAVATKYGQSGKVDQLMLAGHGNNRSMEMSGKQDDKGAPTNDDIDLDHNAMNTDAFLKSVLATISPDAPHRRVLLEACLTNSDALPANGSAALAKDANPTAARADALKMLDQNESLAAHVRRLAADVTQNVSVVGGNASVSPTSLLESNGALTLASSEDPALVADKIDYVKTGTEPLGALRALVSCWAKDPTAAQAAGRARVAALPDLAGAEWAEAVIVTLYGQALAHWDDGAHVARTADAASVLAEMTFDLSVNPDNAASKIVPEDRRPILEALSRNKAWQTNCCRVIGLQLLAAVDPTRRAALLTLFAEQYDAKRLAPYLVTDETLAASLLQSGAGSLDGQVMLAAVLLQNNQSAAAVSFFGRVRPGGHFPGTVDFTRLMGGFLSSTDLTGLLAPTATVDATPNIVLTNGKRMYVTPNAYDFPASDPFPVYAEPDDRSHVVTTIPKGALVRVVGQAGKYFAVAVPGEKTVAFFLGGDS